MSLTINFKPCCEDCDYRKSYVKEETSGPIYAADNIVIVAGEVKTNIGCEHEKVCKGFLEFDCARKINPAEKVNDETEEQMIEFFKNHATKITGLSEGTANFIYTALTNLMGSCGEITLAQYYSILADARPGGFEFPRECAIHHKYGWKQVIDVYKYQNINPDVSIVISSLPAKL